MSGGFTISGGEPLLQDRFVVKMFQAAKGMGIHTALDTNGYYGERLSDAELDPVSYTHLRAHETVLDLVCRLLLEKKKYNNT